jgi:hypothetical protein
MMSMGVRCTVTVISGLAGPILDSSGSNPRFNRLYDRIQETAGLTNNANLTGRGGAVFQISPGC